MLAWALLVLGAVRVAIALVTHEVWGAEASVAACMLVLGLRGTVAR